MKLIRWILFLPAALGASVLAGAAGTFLATLQQESRWWALVISGALSGMAFIFVGSLVAPEPSRAVKWSLISLLLLLGGAAALGSLLGSEPMRSLTGATMILVGLGSMRIPARDFSPQRPAT